MERYYGEKRDIYGRVEPSASVSVFVSGTPVLATIYNASDPLVTPTVPIGNPIYTGSNGEYGFAAPDGIYDIVVQGSGAIDYKKAISLSVTATVNPPQDSSQVVYLAPYAGAVAIAQAIQNGAVLSSLNFPDLATAISGIGSAKVTLIVNSSCAVTNDLTVPANILLAFEGNGIIVLTSGKRLYINGGIRADRNHKCFDSHLLVTTLTASINGGGLVVTAASQNVLAAGHVLSGTNILGGQLIQATYGNTGTGTYSMACMNGFFPSQTVTATGPSVIFGTGTVDVVYAAWFGAVADINVTDNGPAIAQAIYSVIWGGEVRLPAGVSMVNTGGIALHAQLTISFDGASDNGTGAPPNAFTQPSILYLNTDNTNLFLMGGNCSHVTIKNGILGTSPTVGGANLSPVGTNRKLVVMNGHAGQTIYGPRLENMWFCNATMGILINDSWAPSGDGYAPSGYAWSGSIINATDMHMVGMALSYVYEIAVVGTTNWGALDYTLVSGTMGVIGARFRLNTNATPATGNGTVYTMPKYYDWAVNPGYISNSHFIGNSYGIYVNTNNADAWAVRDTVFIIPANGDGIHRKRCGFWKMDNCFAFGTSMTASEFVHDLAVGTDAALDDLLMDHCQAETCAHYYVFDAASDACNPFSITNRNSIHQIGADIYLGKPCEYISEGCQVQSNIYVAAVGIKVHSVLDNFVFQDFTSAPTWGYDLTGGDANSIYTYVPSFYPCTSLAGVIIRGVWIDSVSGDRGDTSQTLVVGTDKQIQRWATALTANRTVTLSTTGVVNSDKFRIVRTGLGAFTLDVGGVKTIPAGTAAFVDVSFDGSAWRLAGYGTL